MGEAFWLILVKKALKIPNFEEKLNVLKAIDLRKIDNFGKKETSINSHKFFAFQLGQTRALLEDNIELFTKNAVAQYYPELAPYLARKENANLNNLQLFFHEFCDFSLKNIKKVDKHDLYFSCFHEKRQVFDAKKEIVLPKVVIFDIDNTLMDETHRAHLREENKWTEYFDECHLDTPIQHIVKLTHEYRDKGYDVWVLSGRSEDVLEKTIASLNEHNVYYDHIKLRATDNFLPDYVLKPAWARSLIGLERIEIVFDDQDKVLEGFKKKGLNVVDVKEITKNKPESLALEGRGVSQKKQQN